MFQKGLSKSTYQNLELLTKLAQIKNFYLAGGTACALHFGHRLSFDLDFFSEKSFDQSNLADAINNLDKFIVEQIVKDTLLGRLNNEKVSFFYYRYPLLKSAIIWKGINITSIADLAAMKLEAISGRGRKRDFIDLYFIAKQISIEQALQLYKKKYKALSNNLRHLLNSLVYFNDANEDDMPKMIKKVSWEEVKKFFQDQTIKLAKSKLKI